MTGSCVTCASRWMTSISRNVSTRLSDPLPRLNRNRELSFGIGQGELEYSAARLIRFRPQFASMSIDDGTAYRQPHACSTGLGGVEGLEDAIEMRRIDARPGIADRHEGVRVVLLGA